MPRLLRARRVAAIFLVASAPAALAHDTWFAIRGAQLPGSALLALGTGDRFPVFEYPISAQHLQQQGCRQADRNLRLTAVANTSTALLVRTQAAGAQPLTCWAQLIPFEIVVEADKIPLYLDEINASPALRQTWDAMRAQGLPWKERYVKHARVEISSPGNAAASPAGPATAASAVPMGMDVVLQQGLQPLQHGDRLAFQVLRDGAPLADFPIELRGGSPAQGRWLRTDREGRVDSLAPEPGAWVLRGTDLRLSSSDPAVWESRFVTLAFTVHAAR